MRIVKAAIVILALSAPLAGQPVERPELFTLEVTDSKDPVVAGEEVTYTITIVNLAAGPIESPRLFIRSHNGLVLGDLEAPEFQQSPRWEDTVIHAEGTAIPEGGRIVATVKGTPVRAGDGTVYLEVEVRGWKGGRFAGEVRSVEATRVTVPPGAQPPPEPPKADVRIIDLSLSIDDSRDPVGEGEEYEYAITVTNAGTTQVDSFYVALDLEGCTLADTNWTTFGTRREGPLAAGASVTLPARVRAGKPGTALAEAHIGFHLDLDLDESDDRATEATAIRAGGAPAPPGFESFVDPAGEKPVDLVVTLRDSKDVVENGETFEIEIVVANDLPVEAPDVKVEVILPEGVELLGIQEEGYFPPVVKRDGQKITFPLSGETGRSRVKLPVRANVPAGGTVNTRVRVTSGGRELDPTDNERTEPTTITPKPPADVPIGMLDGPGTRTVGTRPGSAPAAPGPPAIPPIRLVNADAEGIAATLTDSKDPVESGEALYYTITLENTAAETNHFGRVSIRAGDGIVFENVLSARHVECRGLGSGSVDCLYKPKSQHPDDLDAWMRHQGGLTAGERLDLSFRAVAGLPAGGTVPVRVMVGAMLKPVALDPTGPQGGPAYQDMSLVGTTPIAEQTTTILPPRPAGETALDIQPQPPGYIPWTREDGTLIGATPFDPFGDLFTPRGIDRAFDTPVTPPPPPIGAPDLTLGLSVTPSQVRAGETGTITAEVGNAGDGKGTGVRLQLTLPAQAEFTSSSPASACTAADGVLQCALDELAPGGTRVIVLPFRARNDAGGTFRASGSVFLNEIDANPANNDAGVDIVVTAAPPPQESADLSVTGTATPSPFTVGSTGEFRFEVRNGGPSTARVITTILDMPLPPHTPLATGCEPETATRIRCATDALTSGSTAVFRITATVPSGAASSLSATAGVSASTPDPNPANNQTSVTVPVQQPAASADLQLTTNAVSSVQAGGTIRYFHTAINNGPSPATGVVVTNVFDANATFVTCSPTCTPPGADRVVRCTVPTMAPNTTGQVFVDVRAPASGTVVNQASVAGAEPDPNPANNATTTSTSVIPAAPTCALGIAPGTYQGDGGCGASGAGTVSCASSAEVKIQHPALNLTCNASGNCGDNNTVFGVPNHRCAVQFVSGVIFVHCDQLSGGAPTGASCDQRFTRP